MPSVPYSQNPTPQSTINAEAELDGSFAPNQLSLIDAKTLKIIVKTSGHRLSANAFDALNTFLLRLVVCLSMSSARAFVRPEQEDSLGLAVNLPWAAVMEAVQGLLPAVEGWFSTWHEQLVQHIDTVHHDSLPSKVCLNGRFEPVRR